MCTWDQMGLFLALRSFVPPTGHDVDGGEHASGQDAAEEEEEEEDDADEEEGDADVEEEAAQTDAGAEESSVCILTGDYAMQNVALQMGLRLVAPNGKRIWQTRRWALRCTACFQICKVHTFFRRQWHRTGSAPINTHAPRLCRSPHSLCPMSPHRSTAAGLASAVCSEGGVVSMHLTHNRQKGAMLKMLCRRLGGCSAASAAMQPYRRWRCWWAAMVRSSMASERSTSSAGRASLCPSHM